MPTVEERLAYLEGRVQEYGRFGPTLDRFREELSTRFDTLSARIDAVDQRVREELSARFDVLSARIDVIDRKVDRFREELGARIDAVDQKVDRVREELGARIDSLDDKVSRHFVWLVGMQVTVLLAIVGALLSR